MAIKEAAPDEPRLPIRLSGKETPIQERTLSSLTGVLRRLTAAAESTPILVGDTYLIDRVTVDLPDDTQVGRRRVLSSANVTVPSEIDIEDYSETTPPIARPLPLDTETGRSTPIDLPDEYDETPLPALRLTFRKDGEGNRFNGEVMFFERSREVSVRAECLLDRTDPAIDQEFYGFAHSLGLGSIWTAYTSEDGPSPAVGIFEADLSEELGRQMVQSLGAQT